jgi:predicted ribosome quality control (RQC) complex YloA/Tae2 family protein
MDEVTDYLDNLRQELIEKLNRILSRERGKIKRLQQELGRTEEAEHLALCGELLKANYQALRRGMIELKVSNIYDDSSPEVTISLDPAKSPEDNIKGYFKKSRKLRLGRIKVQKEMESAKERIVKFSEYLSNMENMQEKELASVACEIDSLFPGRAKRKTEPVPKKGPRVFISSDGLKIYVGRNQRENDRMTLHFARAHDLFLHVSGYSGSHVIVRIPAGEKVPANTLIEAATLATYFSKAHERGVTNVSYTEKRNVFKPRGAKPGLVHLRKFKTITVRRDNSLLTKLLSSEVSISAREPVGE